MDNPDFANRISAYRKAKGLSQKEFGDMLEVSNKTVSKWENGESLPKTSTMIKIAELLGIDGNELIGLGETVSADNSAASAQLSDLKNENALLRSQLDFINKRKRKTLIASGIVILVGIIGVILFSVFFTGNENVSNKNINDIGEAGTKIVFDSATYVSPNNTATLIVGKTAYNSKACDRKYAEYYAKDGRKQKVLIFCRADSDSIGIKVKNKTYRYVRREINELKFNTDDINCIHLSGDEYSSDYKYGNNSNNYFYPYTYYSSSDNSPFVSEFCEFYNNRGTPVKKNITELYLGQKRVVLAVEWNYGEDYSVYRCEAGEFFKDDNNNVYYYDYSDTKAYAVREELAKYVYIR